MILTASTISFACACCAEPGTYQVSTTTPDTYQLGLLKDMRFGKSAEVYMTEAGEDDIKGIAGLDLDQVSIVDVFTNNTWKVEISGTNGKKGTLLLPRPAKMTTRKVDLRDKQ